MRIFIMTDIEGAAGVLDANDWIYPHSKYKEDGKKFLTNEVNAAIEGFYEIGASKIVVCDGHGSSAINIDILDPRASVVRGKGGSEGVFGLDREFDVLAHVGQHPKAGAEYGHLCHTQSFNILDYTLNGKSIGEFGQFAFCAIEFGITPILATGDLAFTKEANELIPGIETVSVKRGLTPGTGDECSTDEYRLRNSAAIHYHPKKACEMIREGAKRALKRFLKDPESFKVPKLDPPYKGIYYYRPQDEREAHIMYAEHDTSVSKMMYGSYKALQK